ncbi:AMP-binding protein [Streptomyces sp. NBC_01235]|uniref:AMP-binding protein n=1 Tax=Streptomyces sp. NBC_01235 TaxID=2903788 RepID=UPI002E15C2AB
MDARRLFRRTSVGAMWAILILRQVWYGSSSGVLAETASGLGRSGCTDLLVRWAAHEPDLTLQVVKPGGETQRRHRGVVRRARALVVRAVRETVHGDHAPEESPCRRPDRDPERALAFGGTIVMQPRFEARSTLRLVLDHDVTFFAGVPTMYWGLLAALDDRVDVACLAANLRVAVAGGSALPAEIHKQFKAGP